MLAVSQPARPIPAVTRRLFTWHWDCPSPWFGATLQISSHYNYTNRNTWREPNLVVTQCNIAWFNILLSLIGLEGNYYLNWSASKYRIPFSDIRIKCKREAMCVSFFFFSRIEQFCKCFQISVHFSSFETDEMFSCCRKIFLRTAKETESQNIEFKLQLQPPSSL